jgi:hypothetical protein
VEKEATMKKNAAGFLLSLMVLMLLGGAGCAAVTKIATKDVPRMSVDELKSHLGDPAYVVIDVRAGSDWDGSSSKIKGAVRETGGTVAEWASRYAQNKTIVLYCA